MKTNLDRARRTLTVTIRGDLVSTTADLLRPEITRLLEAPPEASGDWRCFQLDLGGATMVDSVGLNFIITILKTVQKRGAKMQILYTNQNVHRIFLFTRMEKHVELVRTAAMAV